MKRPPKKSLGTTSILFITLQILWVLAACSSNPQLKEALARQPCDVKVAFH